MPDWILDTSVPGVCRGRFFTFTKAGEEIALNGGINSIIAWNPTCDNASYLVSS